MQKLLLKGVRYIKCYTELAFGGRPDTIEATIDYCVDRPILMAQVRSEIVELGKLLQGVAPKRSLEIGTNYGGTLFLLCTVSPPGAQIISVDLGGGPFGGGYPRRKIPLVSKISKKRPEIAPHPGRFALARDPSTRVGCPARREIGLFVHRWRSHV